MGPVAGLFALHGRDEPLEGLVLVCVLDHLASYLCVSDDDLSLHPFAEGDVSIAGGAGLSWLTCGCLALHSGGEGPDQFVPVLLHGQ